jgi:streptomycin 6-kinase
VTESAEGRSWAAGLPVLVSRLSTQWDLAIAGKPYSGGSHSMVVGVVLHDRGPAVLKVPMVDDENRQEAAALRLYDGDGAVRMLEHDAATGAILLEQALPGVALELHPDREYAIGVACSLLRRLRRPVTAGHSFTRVSDQAARWSTSLSAASFKLPDDTSRRLAEMAAETAADLSRSREGLVLVNRDAHLGNILAAEREPYLLIDPKPLVGDPAFDSGYLIDWLIAESPALSAGRLVSLVAAGLGINEDLVCDWGLVRAMDNALWSIGRGDDPGVYVETAATLAALTA